MNCHNIEHKLIFYINGDLSAEENILVESHLKICDACSKKYSQLNNVLFVAGNQKITEVDPFFYTRTYQRLKNTELSKQK